MRCPPRAKMPTNNEVYRHDHLREYS